MNAGCDDDHGGDWILRALHEYEGALIRYAAQITGDPDRARDIVQDTFLKLCRQNRQRVEPHLAEWLFRVCRNAALDVRRKEGRIVPLCVRELDGCSADEPSPDAMLERQDTAGHAAALLRRLPKNQQEVVRLKLQEGFSYDEISRITGLSVSNVGFLLHTAFKNLRHQLHALNSYENRT